MEEMKRYPPTYTSYSKHPLSQEVPEVKPLSSFSLPQVLPLTKHAKLLLACISCIIGLVTITYCFWGVEPYPINAYKGMILAMAITTSLLAVSLIRIRCLV